MKKTLLLLVCILMLSGLMLPVSTVHAAKAPTVTSTDAVVLLSNADTLTISLTAISGQPGISAIKHTLTVPAGVTMKSVTYSGVLKTMEQVIIVNSTSTVKGYSLSTMVTGTGAVELKDSLKLNKGTAVVAYGFANYPIVVNVQ